MHFSAITFSGILFASIFCGGSNYALLLGQIGANLESKFEERKYAEISHSYSDIWDEN